MALNNDFRTNRRTYNEKGGFFGKYTGEDILYPSAGIYSINTSNRILSAGVDVLTLISNVGTNSAVNSAVITLSSNWNSSFSVVSTTSAYWNNAYTVVAGSSAKWDNSYTVLAGSSANWNAVYSAYSLASGSFISNIYASATQGDFLFSELSGGSYPVSLTNLGNTGSPTFSNLTINNNATITGNLSVLGDLTFLNTNVSTTSALSVINNGTGPALIVKQGVGTQPIANFIDADGGVIIFDNSGFVGLNTSAPTERLTVQGGISASGGATLSGVVITGLANSVITSSNKIVTQEAGGVLTYKTLSASKIWTSDTLLDMALGLPAGGLINRIPKTIGGYTLSASNITDSGTDIHIDNGASLTLGGFDAALANTNVVRKIFASNITVAVGSTSGAPVTAFPITDPLNAASRLLYSKYSVLLYTANARTSFELIATNTSVFGGVSGTVYGIMDSQATSLLIDADILNTGANGSLVFSISGQQACKAIIDGTGFYAVP